MGPDPGVQSGWGNAHGNRNCPDRLRYFRLWWCAANAIVDEPDYMTIQFDRLCALDVPEPLLVSTSPQILDLTSEPT